MSSNVRGEITCPLSNFIGCAVEVWDKYFYPTLFVHAIIKFESTQKATKLEKSICKFHCRFLSVRFCRGGGGGGGGGGGACFLNYSQNGKATSGSTPFARRGIV